MRMEKQLTPCLLLLCLAACGQTAPPAAPMGQAAVAGSMTPSPAAATPASASTIDSMLTAAVARDAAARAAREQTLQVQQRLRQQQRAQQQQARDTASQRNERCLGGQRMRRVANGWVEAGAC